jgi:hypothetical protein
MTKKQKQMNNASKMLGILAVLALILAAIIYLSQGSLTQNVNVSEVNEAEDLDKVDQELDEEDVDSIDEELEMLDKDSSGLY